MYSCFHSVGLPQLTILDAIDRVADAGFTAIELNAETLPWAPAHVSPRTSAGERRAIVDACRRRGLLIPAVGAHIEMVSSDLAAREQAVSFVNGCTDLAADVGAPIVHILSGPQAEVGTTQEGWRWFADAVERTTEHAAGRDVTVAIEAIAGHLFQTIDDYHRLIAEMPGVPFKLNFDPSHLAVQGENPRRMVDELGDRIVHVHLKDGKGLFPDFSFPPLGEGTIDFTQLIAGLRAAGYQDALSVEFEAQVYGYQRTVDEILDGSLTFLTEHGIESPDRQ